MGVEPANCRAANEPLAVRSWPIGSVCLSPMPLRQVIYIQPSAPRKPAVAQPCNGCGVCCLAQPCPLGIVLTKARHGACAALRWQDGASRYACGAIVDPSGVLRSALPGWSQALAHPVARLLPLLARRWIAAGQGCDSDLEPDPSPSATMDADGALQGAEAKEKPHHGTHRT